MLTKLNGNCIAKTIYQRKSLFMLIKKKKILAKKLVAGKSSKFANPGLNFIKH